MTAVIDDLVYMLVMSFSVWIGSITIKRGVHISFYWIAAGAIWALALVQASRLILLAMPGFHTLHSVIESTALLGLPLWFHITILLLPENANGFRQFLSKHGVSFVYFATLLFVVSNASSSSSGILHEWLGIWIVVIGSLAVSNLIYRHHALDKSRESLMLIWGSSAVHTGGVLQILVNLEKIPLLYLGEITLVIGLIVLAKGITSESLAQTTTWRLELPSTVKEVSITAVAYSLLLALFHTEGYYWAPIIMMLLILGICLYLGWSTGKTEAQQSSEVIQQIVTPNLSKQDQEKVSRITPREKEVLLDMADGNSTDETARNLQISFHTVKKHKRNIYEKLGANNQTAAVREGERLGTVPPKEKE